MRDQEGGRAPDDATRGSASELTVGKRSLVAQRYPVLAKAIEGRRDGSEPTIHDAATAAVDGKDGGAAVDGGVAAQVGAHLGADLGGVRVHQDPLAQEATAAMGARAFAYGGDVFLGAGESGGDLGLMAHELTHVVQQGAAGQRTPQRQVQVGDANTPAEQQADQVAAAVTGGQAAPAALLVDDGPVQPGQMLKSQFIEQLRAQVTAAADEELGPIYSAIGCPYIDRYFSQYTNEPATSGEALLKRFAPATRGARTAADMIPAVVARVRAGVRTWRDTGQPPPELASVAPGAGAGPAAPLQAQALRAPDGHETLASLEADLGAGQPLDGGTASRMSDALGVDLADVRVHTGPVAARKAGEAGALAFAVGSNVVMGASAPAAGTLEGDALLAHELAHTAQQAGAASDPLARMLPIGGESAAAEVQADEAAVGALAQLHGEKRGLAGLAQRLGGAFKTGLQLQRCPDNPRAPQQQQQQQQQPPHPGPPPGAALIGEVQTLIDGATWEAIRRTAYPRESAPGIARARERHAGTRPDLTGLGALTVLDRFAGEVRRIQTDWPRLNPVQRKDQLGAAASAELARVDVPGFLHVLPLVTEFKGAFAPGNWTFFISEALITAGTLPDRDAGEVCNTTLHEARHAEQHFLAARFQAETNRSDTIAQIAAANGVPVVIARQAHRLRLTGAPQPVRDLAQRMHQSMVTDGRANQRITNDDGLAELATRRAAAQTALDALRLGATPQTIADAERTRDELRAQIAEVERLYTLYRNIPHEADAHEVGDSAELAFQGWR